MKISSIRLHNLMSFTDSGEIEFSDGINIIVGQNNSGKSAFLRSMVFPLIGDSHRNKDRFEDYDLIKPNVEISLEFDALQFEKRLLQTRGGLSLNGRPTAEASAALRRLFDSVARFRINVSSDYFNIMVNPLQNILGQYESFYATINPVGGEMILEDTLSASPQELLESRLQRIYSEDVFYFTSERYSIGKCTRGYAGRLTSNASNLPAVLDTLSGERGSLYETVIAHLREIFPSFGNLSIRPSPTDGSAIEILVWPEAEMPRRELAFSLEASGTGIAQVLAILTAVATMENCVVIIDEINSFLHPAATKSLLRILSSKFSQHQYIISTHSAEVIAFAENKAIFVVKRLGYVSEIKNVSTKNQKNFQEVADLLGISMTDVFSADRVLWVEGPTEELCFQYLYTKYSATLLRGLAIISATTGDFIARRRDRALIYEIYTRLSSASSSLVVTVGFSFDAEKLSEADQEQMIRDSQGKLSFLPRRQIECYLVNANAIADFINQQDFGQTSIVSEADVALQLGKIAIEQRFNQEAPWQNDLKNEKWLSAVDASRLIDRCCGDLSENRVSYMKKGHALSLLSAISDKNPDEIAELKNYVLSIVAVEQ